jgi:hypothetical protein
MATPKKANPKRPGPKGRRHTIDFDRVKRCAAGFMSNREIALTIGYAEQTFYVLLDEIPELRAAIQEGRQLGLESATNCVLVNIKERNFQAAKWLLSKHGELWRDEPQKLEVSGSLNLEGGLEVRARFDQAERDRLVELYLADKREREQENSNRGVSGP